MKPVLNIFPKIFKSFLLGTGVTQSISGEVGQLNTSQKQYKLYCISLQCNIKTASLT